MKTTTLFSRLCLIQVNFMFITLITFSITTLTYNSYVYGQPMRKVIHGPTGKEITIHDIKLPANYSGTTFDGKQVNQSLVESLFPNAKFWGIVLDSLGNILDDYLQIVTIEDGKFIERIIHSDFSYRKAKLKNNSAFHRGYLILRVAEYTAQMSFTEKREFFLNIDMKVSFAYKYPDRINISTGLRSTVYALKETANGNVRYFRDGTKEQIAVQFYNVDGVLIFNDDYGWIAESTGDIDCEKIAEATEKSLENFGKFHAELAGTLATLGTFFLALETGPIPSAALAGAVGTIVTEWNSFVWSEISLVSGIVVETSCESIFEPLTIPEPIIVFEELEWQSATGGEACEEGYRFGMIEDCEKVASGHSYIDDNGLLTVVVEETIVCTHQWGCVPE